MIQMYTFIDVAGMRALRGRKAQPVVVLGARDSFRRLLTLMAWDTDPGIELVEAL